MLTKINQNKIILFVFILLILYVWILSLSQKMNDRDLNIIWVCTQCKQSFLFNSDMQDHKTCTGHSRIHKFDLLSGRMIDSIEMN